MVRSRPKYHRGWYVSVVGNNIKGKIIDVYETRNGYEYTITVSGTLKVMSFHESQLVKEGNQL
jgi:hypothetical protein